MSKGDIKKVKETEAKFNKYAEALNAENRNNFETNIAYVNALDHMRLTIHQSTKNPDIAKALPGLHESTASKASIVVVLRERHPHFPNIDKYRCEV